MITQKMFEAAANAIGTDIATIKAVAEVESAGGGFLPNGAPLILFEPHVFWRNLIKRGKNPSDYVKGNSDILYPKWGTKPYGSIANQHARLAKAVKIDRDAALASASWGKFQILGENWKDAGYELLQDFINAMFRSEDDHLRAFLNFVKSKGLDKYLRTRTWDKFAEGYNGKSYKKNKYDIKLAKAYQKYAQEK
jgi:hypothetical protein